MPAMKRSLSANRRISAFLNQTGTGKKRLRRTVTTSIPRQLKETANATASNLGIACGFPAKSKQVTLKYCDTHNVNGGAAGLAAEVVYRANDAFDPYFTGAGHQPYGFDQWTLVYKSFCVVASRIKVSANTTTSANDACVAGVYISKTSTAYSSDPFACLELNTCSDSMLVGNFSTGKDRPMIKAACNVVPFFGKDSKADLLDDEDACGSSTASPTDVAYYHLWVAGVNNSDPAAANYLVQLEYDVIFFDPISPAQS